MTATQQAFDINIESLFNDVSNPGEIIEELQKFSLAPSSSCLSCQVGIPQHINRKDLLKVESLSKYFSSSFLFLNLCLVYNQVRGFKTRHSQSSGVGGNPPSTGSTRMPNDFDGYRLAVGGSGRSSQYPNDPNQPPLTAIVNRVKKFYFIFFCLIIFR